MKKEDNFPILTHLYRYSLSPSCSTCRKEATYQSYIYISKKGLQYIKEAAASDTIFDELELSQRENTCELFPALSFCLKCVSSQIRKILQNMPLQRIEVCLLLSSLTKQDIMVYDINYTREKSYPGMATGHFTTLEDFRKRTGSIHKTEKEWVRGARNKIYFA